MEGSAEPAAGAELPLLLASAFRLLIDDLHRQLTTAGHEQARPIHGFTLQAIDPAGVNISELARRTGVTKQAAAKTATGLERLGYVSRRADPADARASVIERTARGNDLLAKSAEIFDRLRAEWVAELGASRVEAIEQGLRTMTTRDGVPSLLDFPAWMR